MGQAGLPGESSAGATLFGYGAFLVVGWLTVLVPALILSIQDAFGVSDAAMGAFYFASALAYAVGSLAGGLLTERLGHRTLLLLSALLLAVGLTGQAVAPSWIGFLLAGVVRSWAAGAIDGGVNALFLALHPEGRGKALNLLHLFFSLGAMLGPLAVGQLVAAGVPWQTIVLGTAPSGVVLAAILVTTSLPAAREVNSGADGTGGELLRAEQSRLPFLGLAIGIGCYVAAEIGVSSWIVRFLSAAPVSIATGALGLFWGGLALGRLLFSWIADRFDPVAFAVACTLAASAALVGAVLSPFLPLAVVLFGLAGLWFGPVYPMIMTVGGSLYPHRLAALSGGLTTAAVIGGIIYPPLIGVMAEQVGVGVGMLGAGLLGVPTALALVSARVTSRRPATV